MKFEWTAASTLAVVAFVQFCEGTWLNYSTRTTTPEELTRNFQIPFISQVAMIVFNQLALFVSVTESTGADTLPDDYFKMFNQQRGRPINTPEVKKLYKKLSLKYHPDRNKEPDAQQKFMKVNQAYEVLMDDEKRSIYERYGEEGLKNSAAGGQGGFRDPFDIFAQ